MLGPRRETARALPPAMAVAGLAGRKENGPTLTIYDVYYIKSMFPSGGHGRGPRLALQNRTAVRPSLDTRYTTHHATIPAKKAVAGSEVILCSVQHRLVTIHCKP